MPGGTNPAYSEMVLDWQDRALRKVNLRVGALPGTIEHLFHGSKAKRGYLDRWGMFVNHQFHPYKDTVRNKYGVLDFAGNKPQLVNEFDRYLRSRREDDNCL